MPRWIIRGLLLVLLVVSVDPAGILRARARHGADIESAVLYLLAREGMIYRETRDDGVLKSMLFALPSCAKPLVVVPSPRTFDSNTLLKRVGAPDDVHRFVYLTRVSEQEARYSFFLEHLKHSALGLIAMTPYQADGMMLLINEPQGCKASPAIDWSLVWRSDYRIEVARNAGLPIQ
jgi:hypothetical protein